jgi:hypothetical protein
MLSNKSSTELEGVGWSWVGLGWVGGDREGKEGGIAMSDNDNHKRRRGKGWTKKRKKEKKQEKEENFERIEGADGTCLRYLPHYLMPWQALLGTVVGFWVWRQEQANANAQAP